MAERSIPGHIFHCCQPSAISVNIFISLMILLYVRYILYWHYAQPFFRNTLPDFHSARSNPRGCDHDQKVCPKVFLYLLIACRPKICIGFYFCTGKILAIHLQISVEEHNQLLDYTTQAVLGASICFFYIQLQSSSCPWPGEPQSRSRRAPNFFYKSTSPSTSGRTGDGSTAWNLLFFRLKSAACHMPEML